jgi:hypothetical protein
MTGENIGEIAIDPAHVGEGISYIEALTGKLHLPLPDRFPSGQALDDARWAQVDVYSLELAPSVGRGGFVNVSSSATAQVLVRDYLYSNEIPTPRARATDNPIRSIVYGAGFRVALAVYDIDAITSTPFDLLAAKAEASQKRISVDLRVVGIPKGPPVPAQLANGNGFDVESYRQLQSFAEDVQRYLMKQADLEPQPIAATLDPLDGQRLIDLNPGVRFAMWLIFRNNSLKEAIAIAGRFPGVQEFLVRTVYSAVFRRPEMLRADGRLEGRRPPPELRALAGKWLGRYESA